METFHGSLSICYEKLYGIVNIREPKTRRVAGHAAQQHLLLECLGLRHLVNTVKSSIPDHRLDTAIWRFTAAQYFANFQRKLRSLGVSHQHVELPISGFNIVIYHFYDAEVGGPLKGSFEDTFKKGHFFHLIETGSPQKLRTVSVLSQNSHLVSLQNNTTERPATKPHNHHVATERVEEFTPSCAAASSNGALPTPSRLSPLGALPSSLMGVGRKQRTSSRRTRYGHSHTGMDHVVSRVRRSRFGAASSKIGTANKNRNSVRTCMIQDHKKSYSRMRAVNMSMRRCLFHFLCFVM